MTVDLKEKGCGDVSAGFRWLTNGAAAGICKQDDPFTENVRVMNAR